MIRVNCFFQANEEQYATALETALALVAASREHAGCVSYDVFESGTRPDVFMFCETWTSPDKTMRMPLSLFHTIFHS